MKIRRHDALFCAGPWPFIWSPALLLLILLTFQWHAIEQKIEDNVRNQIRGKYSWAQVETYNRGRDVLLLGLAPNESSVNTLLEQAKKAEGVNSVKFIGEIAVPPIKRNMRARAIVCSDLVLNLLNASSINFKQGLVEFSESSIERLNDLSEIFKHCPDTRFEIVGHTDDIGDETTNIKLSNDRAKLVVEHLGNLGVDTRKLRTRGAGASEPIAENNTEKGRATNRRIEFRKLN